MAGHSVFVPSLAGLADAARCVLKLVIKLFTCEGSVSPFSHIIDISPTGPQYSVTFVLVPLLPVILVVCYMEHYITFRNLISHYNTRSESFGRCIQQQSTNDHTPRNRLKGTGFLAKTY